MADPTLQQLLSALHSRLEAASSLGEEERQSLRALSADIQAALAQAEPHSDAAHAGIRDRLQSAAAQFELTHPDIAMTLLNVVQGLSDRGI